MINLYEKLGITPNASKEEIENAIKSAAQKKALPLEILQQAKNYLLNPNMKKNMMQNYLPSIQKYCKA